MAARVKDSLVKALRQLKQVFRIMGKDLITFVSHSVVVSLDGDNLSLESLRRLAQASVSPSINRSRGQLVRYSVNQSIGWQLTRGASASAPGAPGTRNLA